MATTEVKPLFYRPPPRWYFWTALGAALAIHLTAVAVSQRHEAPPVDLPPQPPQVVEAVLAPPESTPPPEDIPIPEPPPPPDVQPEFVEERTPPPRPQNTAQNLRQSKPLGRCRCLEQKRSPCMRRNPSILTRRVRGMLREVE